MPNYWNKSWNNVLGFLRRRLGREYSGGASYCAQGPPHGLPNPNGPELRRRSLVRTVRRTNSSVAPSTLATTTRSCCQVHVETLWP